MVLTGYAGRVPRGLSCSARSTLPHFPPLSIETRGDVPPRPSDFAGHPSYHRPGELFVGSASLRASIPPGSGGPRQLPANPLFTPLPPGWWGAVGEPGGAGWEKVVRRTVQRPGRSRAHPASEQVRHRANSGAAPGTGAAPLSAAEPARTPGGYSSNLRRKRSSMRSVNPPERRGRPRPPVARSDDPEPAESLGAPPPRPGVAPLAPPSRSSTPAPNITMNPIRLMIGKPPGRTGRAIPATSRTRPSMNKAAAWSRRRLEAVRRRPPRTDDANFGSSA